MPWVNQSRSNKIVLEKIPPAPRGGKSGSAKGGTALQITSGIALVPSFNFDFLLNLAGDYSDKAY